MTQESPNAAELLRLEERRLSRRSLGNALLLLAILFPIAGGLTYLAIAVLIIAPDEPPPYPEIILPGILLLTVGIGVASGLAFAEERRTHAELRRRYPPAVIRSLPFGAPRAGERYGEQRVIESSPSRLRVRHLSGALLAVVWSLGSTVLAALLALGAAAAVWVMIQNPSQINPKAVLALAVGAFLLGVVALRTIPIGWVLDLERREFSLLSVRLGLLITRTRTPAEALGRIEAALATGRIPSVEVETPKGRRTILLLHPPTPRHGLKTPADAERHHTMNRWIAENFAFHAASMLAAP